MCNIMNGEFHGPLIASDPTQQLSPKVHPKLPIQTGCLRCDIGCRATWEHIFQYCCTSSNISLHKHGKFQSLCTDVARGMVAKLPF